MQHFAYTDTKHVNVNSYCLEGNYCSRFFSSTTDEPAACNIRIPSPAVVFTARHSHLHPTDHLHAVNLVDRHLHVEQWSIQHGSATCHRCLSVASTLYVM